MFKATKIGDFETKALFECLEKEPKAEKMFEMATKELFVAMEKQDPKIAIKGLDDELMFMMDLAFEKDEKTHDPICEMVNKEPDNWSYARKIGALMKNKETTIQADKDGNLMFNGKDFMGTVKKMEEAFKKKEMGWVGYIFGEGLMAQVAPKEEE